MRKLMLIVVVLFILSGCVTKQDQNVENVSLMLDYTPNTNHTGLYVAIDKGYYEEKGLNLEIVDTASSSVEQSVANDVVDFGISYEENITQAFDQGINNITSIYAILKENTSGFISNKNKNITSAKDFENKKYCGWGTNVEEAIVKQVAKDANVNNIDIVSGGVDFLHSNDSDCDFFWEFQGWTNIQADLENIQYNYISLKDLSIDFYTPIIITSKTLEQENPNLVQNFISATIKGYEYTANNPQEAANIFLKYNPTYDKDMIENSLNFLSEYYINDNGYAGYQNDKIWKDFTNFLYNSDVINSKEYKNMYTNKYVNEYYKS